MKKYAGFSLIELLVVVSITVLFLGTGIAQYNRFTVQTKLINEAKKLTDVLELAKKKALSADLIPTPGNPITFCSNFTGYRVIVSAGTYSLNFNCNGTIRNIQDYDLSSNISIISGAGNYNFTPLMVGPIFASATLRIKNSTINKCVDISITPAGIIELDEEPFDC